MSSLLRYGVLMFCLAIAVAAAWGTLFPSQLCRQARAAWHRRYAMPTAVVARILLGTMLIYFGEFSKFPQLFRLFGVLGLVAAAGLALAGWQRIDSLMSWIESRPGWWLRAWTALGVVLAAILFYGAV